MLAAFAAAILLGAPDNVSDQLAGWGRETFEAIKREYALPGSGQFAEAVKIGDPKKAVAFNWSVGVLLSAFNAAATWDPSYKTDLIKFAYATRDYLKSTGPVPGYDVLPNATSVDRYYDDNAWMVMALADTSDVTSDPKYLGWAKDALRFSLSGEDDKLGGGIYWRENERKSKNTCSNAPTAAACLSVYRHYHDPDLLATAERLYAWTKQTLQDPQDHLMWDSIAVSDGRIEKTKWSYNTALMIRSAVDLYRITKKPGYLHDEKQMRVASLRRWLDPATNALKDGGPFAHLLLDAWIEAESIDATSREARITTFAGPLRFLHASCRKDGFYGDRWDKAVNADQVRFQLIDQASAARSYFRVAAFLK